MVKTAYVLAAAGAAMLVAFLFYGDVIRFPNAWSLSGHDGLKNYFTCIYHARHDESFSRFEGMNYPFGEHVVFADAQPPLAGALMALRRAGVDLTHWGVGIINLLPWLGLGVCAGALWLLTTRMGAGPLFSLWVAVALALLNPTIRRWSGHFALSYGFVLPVAWLLVLNWRQTPRWAWSIALALFCTFFAWTHLYWGMLTAAFLTAFWVVLVFRKPGMVAYWPHFVVQAVFPLLSVQIWLTLTDNVVDRPHDPYGFLVYRAAWEGIFLPLGMPLGDALGRIVKVRHVEWEGLVYVGLGTTAMCVAFAARSLRAAFFRRPSGFEVFSPFAVESLVAAIVLLLFSFGVPFVFFPEKVQEWLGPLRQFRSIGRFAWWFYFVAGVVSAVAVYRTWSRGGGVRRLFALSFLVVWAYEVYAFHDSLHLFDNKFPNPFLKSWAVNARDFQAIVPRPYFHVGSERMNVGEDALERIAPDAFSLSVATGLPLTAVMMSRTSFSQTMENLGWGPEPLAPPAVLNRVDDGRPLLLLSRDSEDARPAAGRPEAFALPLGHERLYALPLDYFAKSPKIRRNLVADTLRARRADLWLSGATGFAFAPDTVVLPEKALIPVWGARLPVGGRAVLSFWMRLRRPPLFTDITVRYFAAGLEKGEEHTRNDACLAAMAPDGAFLVERTLSPPQAADSAVVYLRAARTTQAWSFMLRDGDVYQCLDGLYRFNNRIFDDDP
ncbi:MAG: hypothetical protein RMM53_03625 [Bacteroidia bacterium]|nr:hypothetical protein [Bacteroidia bacterium]